VVDVAKFLLASGTPPFAIVIAAVGAFPE